MKLRAYQALRYVYQPAPAPATHTLLLLPGTGGDEHALLPLAARFGQAVNVLSLRGNVLENGQPRFFRRLGLGLFDEEDVIFRTHELVHFLPAVSQTEGFDLTRLVAVGYSNGANMAGSILMLYPELLAGAVLWRPRQPLAHTRPALATRRPPVFFCTGMHDPTVQLEASDGYVTLFRAAGFAVTRQRTDAGHHLIPTDIETAVRWFQQHFAPKPSLIRS
jgi:predicted esterase